MEPNEQTFEELSDELFESVPEEKQMVGFFTQPTQAPTVTPNQDNTTETVQD